MARTLIYLFGFDPRGARYYANLFRDSVEQVHGIRGTRVGRASPEAPKSIELQFEIAGGQGPVRTRPIIPDWRRLILRATSMPYISAI